MDGAPTDFWGKLDVEASGEVRSWHPLEDHCCDVASVVEVLLEPSALGNRLAAVSGIEPLTAEQRAQLATLAALHDLGKFTIPFQAKGRPEFGSTGGHVDEAISAVLAADELVAPTLAALRGFGVAAHGLLRSAIGHHGQPRAGGLHQVSRWAPRGGLAPLEGLLALVHATRSWFPAAFGTATELPESAALEHAFAGVVMLADWVASDTRFFPFSRERGARRGFARLQAGDVVRRLGLFPDASVREGDSSRGCFERISPFTPTAAQRAILDIPASASGLTVLESETGSGKTEAALAHFMALYARGAVDGLYFALPTRTAAMQIFERIRKAMARGFASPPPVTLAVPGYLRVDDAEGQALPDFEVLWPDRERFHYRAWAAEMPKRYLAGSVVVGTIDQVLLSSLMVPHAHLRAVSLLRHLLVVDEVHASDAYMNRILESVLARHGRAGGHALLLSATLGSDARQRLLAAWSGRGAGVRGGTAPAAYPLVSHQPRGGPLVETAVAYDGRSRRLTVAPVAAMERAEAVAELALAAARQGAKVLVLRQTVRDCLETQAAVEALASPDDPALFRCEGQVAPHHARFSRDDRLALDRALEARIGKTRAEGPCVVVATQTVQQSLDVDVDLLITDLCPIDVLLQRLGRLHRHERPRPAGFETARGVVLVPEARSLEALLKAGGEGRNHHGLGSIYGDLRVIEATWRQLELGRDWVIPTDCRALVEACLAPTALAALTRELGGRFLEHEAFVLGKGLGHRRQADLNLVDWTVPYSLTSFPDRADERIATRLGEGDRRIGFADGVRGPFGLAVRELTMPSWWARGVDAEAEAADISQADGRLEFTFGEYRFTYDRRGLRREDSATKATASEGTQT